MYPCTIDQDYIDLSVTIANLFGHLCFGSTFAHDEEMEKLASERENLKKASNDRDSQTLPSSRKRNVDHEGTTPVRLPISASDSESHAIDDLERVPKRPRTSSLVLQNWKVDPHMRSLPSEVLTPERKLPKFKKSLKSYLREGKKDKTSPTPKSTSPPSNHVSSHKSTSQTASFGHQGPSAATHVRKDSSANIFYAEHLAKRPADVHCGTQKEPTDVSDDDPSSQGNEAGDFLLEEMPMPDDMSTALNESQLDSETQVTLSDATFESQSLHANPDINAVRLQRRKEAYKAAKEPSVLWGVDQGLISTITHHGEEEVEL